LSYELAILGVPRSRLRRGATREALGPYLAIMETLAELDRLGGNQAPDLQRYRPDEMEPLEMDAGRTEAVSADDMGQQDAGAARGHGHRPKRACRARTIDRFNARPATPTR
jgi:hypothetical protein